METSVRCFFVLVFVTCSARPTEVKSKDEFQWLSIGESLTITCSTTDTDYDGVYLLLGLHADKDVFFLYGEDKELTPGTGYSDRLRTKGELNNLEVTIANVTEDDSGVYWCKYRRLSSLRSEKFLGSGSTVVVVAGGPSTQQVGTVLQSNLLIVTAVCAGSMFLLCLTVLLIWKLSMLKKSLRERRGHARRSDSVYEDMRKRNSSPGGLVRNNLTGN